MSNDPNRDEAPFERLVDDYLDRIRAEFKRQSVAMLADLVDDVAPSPVDPEVLDAAYCAALERFEPEARELLAGPAPRPSETERPEQ